MIRRLLIVVASLTLAAACAVPGRTNSPNARYDFGLPGPGSAKSAVIRGSVLVPEVDAPEWLDASGIVYRLAYADDARTRTYAQSRWVAPPAALVTQRLRSGIERATQGRLVLPDSGAKADWALQVQLDEFSQVFEGPEASRALARMRATLVKLADRQVVAQKTFGAESVAATADAPGGAKALAQAADEVVASIVEWTADQTSR